MASLENIQTNLGIYIEIPTSPEKPKDEMSYNQKYSCKNCNRWKYKGCSLNSEYLETCRKRKSLKYYQRRFNEEGISKEHYEILKEETERRWWELRNKCASCLKRRQYLQDTGYSCFTIKERR